ncbi:MAG TPA: aminotransferase class V-fold PLP-dependent enzyme, partial [Solirubrobacteraceae bacterium]|nr:aminotransferase class V-fold PLP-dependent enzyme [Solirubrobacteraceae bacterium]
APVRAAIERHRRGLDRDPRRYLAVNEHREEDAAGAAAGHLRTRADHIALTDSTTMGLGTVFGGLRLGAGDEILMTRHEHFSARQAATFAAARTGAELREVELYPPREPERATAEGIVRAIERGIGAATRVVLVTWVHSSSGMRLPLRDIARAVDGRALLVVDAAHALGAGRIAVEETGCDVLVAGCHKWLAGPRGTGIVWARESAWERMAPTIPSFRGGSRGALLTPGGYHSFEHRWALNEAFALHDAIGPERIARRIDGLARRLRAGLKAIEGVTVHAPDDPVLHSGVVTFSVRGTEADALVDRLARRHGVLGSVTPYDIRLARFGTCWMNTRREVDAAIRAVAASAG